jgi:hypothetical protein
MDDLNKAIELKSDNAKAYFSRAQVESILKQTDKACIDFKKAKELGYLKADEFIIKYCN